MFKHNRSLLGVIGGLGPLATAHFLELVVDMTDARTDQENVDMIIYNFPSIPDRTGYLLGSNLKSPLPGLLSVGHALARDGVSCIAIPCITAHYFYPRLEAELPVPILNGVRETARCLKDAGVHCAGILASEGTIHAGLFNCELECLGIRPVVPSPSRQADVTSLIYDDIKAGRPPELSHFAAAEAELRAAGAEVIILGCTELSIIKRDFPIGPGFLDAMEVMARQSVLRCGSKLRRKYRSLIT